ncbi:alpha/beta fold hydrolase [Streptomyces rubiginosohelvolus]|uniref:alpha/beta fold hydrolase n=1 Tax=Streptomyces rubiginosohelvolus TaxID=67362 RepID=UPI0037B4F1A5
MPAVVLVHGLYHRPEHFDAVARRQRSSGLDAVAPELHRGSPEAETEGGRPAPTSGCGRGVPHRHSWKDTPSTYVVCGQDRAIGPAPQRTMASRCTEVREWGTGHSPFVGQPSLLVGLLRELLVPGRRP